MNKEIKCTKIILKNFKKYMKKLQNDKKYEKRLEKTGKNLRKK